MFKFDQVALPKLLIRKALLVVDFQRDFVSDNGTLPITLPSGYVERTIRLAKAFREIGDVIWVNSKFEEMRPPCSDHMNITGLENSDRHDFTTDPDAFLSNEKAKCVLSSKLGAELPQSVKEEGEKKDVILLKSHYSAFEGTGLLRLLRARMTMEVYICGSLINAGVYATVIDAAGHGLSITLVHDCCGYSSEPKQARAVKALTNLTGCSLSSASEIVHIPAKAHGDSNLKKQETVRLGRQSDDIAESMRALALDDAAPRGAESGTLQSALEKASPKKKEVTGNNATGKAYIDEVNYGINDTSYKKTACGLTGLSAGVTDGNRDNTTTMNNTESSDGGIERNDQMLQNLCEGDTDVFENLLPPELEDGIFEKLSSEVQWLRMSHQGGEVPRLVAVQGDVGDDGHVPIYRHPSDESPPLLPFSPIVLAIKAETEKQLGHKLNHVLIQFYRDGKDYISEHSDKTLDIVRGSYIANVSLGAKRTMVLRTKRSDKDPSNAEQAESSGSRRVQRAPLPHNSLCRMGLKTNMKWLHSIRQDKRADREKTPEELAYGGARISLTFRQIGTFLDKDETMIWGQGASGKTRNEANKVINGQTEESIRMLRAFGIENHSSIFDWDTYYGKGFDVLHLRSAPRLFASSEPIINMRISLMLTEYEIGYASGSITQAKNAPSQPLDKSNATGDILIKYVDNDDDKTEVCGDIAIMLYLYTNHQKKKGIMKPRELARQFTLFQKSLGLLKRWHELQSLDTELSLAVAAKAEISLWTACTDDAAFIGGNRPSIADFSFWPVLYSMVEKCGKEILTDSQQLCDYYETMNMWPSTVKTLDRVRAQ